MDTPEIILLLLLLLLLPYGRINSRMTSYLKIFVLIDFHFQDAIFPFNRAAPYGMTSAVPREQGRTSARSAERPLALDPRRSEGPHEAKFPFNSLSNAIRSKISGSNRADKSENFPRGGVHSCLKSRILPSLRIIRTKQGTKLRI